MYLTPVHEQQLSLCWLHGAEVLGKIPCVLKPQVRIHSRNLPLMNVGAHIQERGQRDLGGCALGNSLLRVWLPPPAPEHDRRERQTGAVCADARNQASGVAPGLRDGYHKVRRAAGGARRLGLLPAAAQYVSHVDHRLVKVEHLRGRRDDVLLCVGSEGRKVLGYRLGGGKLGAGLVKAGGLNST